jgi:hypothetical protein
MSGTTAASELAPVGKAINSDLAGELNATLIASQQSQIAAATSELSAALEKGIPEAAPREEFAAVAEAGRPMYEHLKEVGFFESTTEHLPEFNPSYLDDAVTACVGAEALSGTRNGFEFVGGEPVELHGQFGLPSPLWITHDGGESWSFAFDDIDVRETSVAEELSVGDELAATYVVPGTVPAGPCSLAGEFAALWQANPDDYNKSSGVYPFEVELTLTES